MMKKSLLKQLVVLTIVFLAAVMVVSLTHAGEDESEGANEFDYPLLEAGAGSSDLYILELSGMVGTENFVRANALLHIGASDDFDPNVYVMTIQGYPRLNARNTFFWDSKDAPMTALSNHLTSEISLSAVKPPNIHFFYLSPLLLENLGAETQHEEERLAQAEAAALPTLIKAQAGKLDLRLYGSTISGTVWLKGYDVIQKSYVFYRAHISGRRAVLLETSRKQRN